MRLSKFSQSVSRLRLNLRRRIGRLALGLRLGTECGLRIQVVGLGTLALGVLFSTAAERPKRILAFL